jgi:hypothetical protein
MEAARIIGFPLKDAEQARPENAPEMGRRRG